MKRNFGLVILALFCAVVFTYGCAGTGKSVLQEEQAANKEAAVSAEAKQPAAAEGTMKEDEAAKRAAQEQAERAAALKAEAEREAALKAQAAREAAERAKAAEKAVVVPSQALYEFADVNFDFDKFNLTAGARDILKKHAEWLNKNTDVMVVVEGHCDERGTAEYNLALGERRAGAAAKYLTDTGIDAKRIKTVSYGFERPLDPGHNEEAWAKNRRAHFVASGKK